MNATTTAILRRRPRIDRRKPVHQPMSSDVARIRTEYVEMPGLVLTLPQAARLWGLTVGRSSLLLSMLVETGFLIGDKKTGYRRPVDRSDRRDGEARSIPGKAEEVVPTHDIVKAREAWDIVDEASFESFPASDPPSWTVGVDPK